MTAKNAMAGWVPTYHLTYFSRYWNLSRGGVLGVRRSVNRARDSPDYILPQNTKPIATTPRMAERNDDSVAIIGVRVLLGWMVG
ncbi:hypothetical protein M0802_004617 [Mischocyttarus mexicanus]|nr:hypothetical protein M0802_004617 [Mischocyttarus mexicanus]